jgi:hypothetical protein
MNPEYGPFANIVALAGCIIAAAMAIALAWVRGAKWQPPEEELPGATTKFSALVCGVAIAILYVIGQKELGIGGLARLAGWSVGLAVVALLTTVYVNTVYSYQGQSGARILGGYRLTGEAKSIQREKKLTVQKIFDTGGYDKDLVWTRSSRGLVRVLSSVTYLALQTLGSIGLAAAALLMGFAAAPQGAG